MNLKRLAISLLGCLAVMLLASNPASAAASPCTVTYLNTEGPPDLNAEGTTERGADIVISNVAGMNCFTTGSILTVSYNANMSVPANILLADKGKYWNIIDPTDSLVVGAISVQQAVSASGIVTVIEFDIENGGTNPTALLVLENLRFDVTGTTGVGFQSVGDGHPLNAYVGTSNPPTTTAGLDIGNVKKTVNPALTGVTVLGWGFEDGVCPFPGGCGFPNKGATTGSLIQQAWWRMTTNNAWTTDFPFRRVGEHSPNPADPNLIGQTDLVLHVQNIMQGVTVTVPNSLIACNGAGVRQAQWDYASGSKTATGGDLVAIYKTVYSNQHNPVTLTVATTDDAADPGCDAVSLYPLISVKVGSPSLNSPDGTMQAYLQVVMGPADSLGQFAGDDVAAAGTVPRYLNDVALPDAPTRGIIGASKITDPFAAPYFFLNPTQTVLLYPYVTTIMGWDTGIEIANTGNDGAVFGNTGQAGKLDVYFFPTNGTPFVYTVAAGVGRGLDAKGNLQPGGDFADLASDLAAKAGHPFTEGYIIIVGHFNYGHGGGFVFNAGTGGWTSTPALVLGGNCSFNANKAQFNATTGAPEFPACSSARQGDLTKLPERLDQ
jgi:hypothetical protein